MCEERVTIFTTLYIPTVILIYAFISSISLAKFASTLTDAKAIKDSFCVRRRRRRTQGRLKKPTTTQRPPQRSLRSIIFIYYKSIWCIKSEPAWWFRNNLLLPCHFFSLCECAPAARCWNFPMNFPHH